MAKEIRFAVGSREDIRSSIWRLWANKSDLYLAARTTSGVSKISFHQSGICRFAVVSTTPRAPLKAWQRPRESEPGVTPLYSIVVPAFTVEERICEKPPPPHKSIVYLDPPEPGTKVIIRILLTSSTFTEDDVLRLPRTHPIRIVGSVQLTREIAWLVAYSDVLKDEEVKFLTRLVSTTTLRFAPGSSLDDLFCNLHSLEGSANNPMVVDVQLGRGNLEVLAE